MYCFAGGRTFHDIMVHILCYLHCCAQGIIYEWFYLLFALSFVDVEDGEFRPNWTIKGPFILFLVFFRYFSCEIDSLVGMIEDRKAFERLGANFGANRYMWIIRFWVYRVLTFSNKFLWNYPKLKSLMVPTWHPFPCIFSIATISPLLLRVNFFKIFGFLLVFFR